MMQRLVNTTASTVLCDVESFYRTMNETAKLTVQCLRDTVAETEDGWNMEAFDELLSLWIKLSRQSCDDDVDDD